MLIKKIVLFLLVAFIGYSPAMGISAHENQTEANQSSWSHVFMPKKVIGTLTAGVFGNKALYAPHRNGLYAKLKSWWNTTSVSPAPRVVKKEFDNKWFVILIGE